jgi:hypothetical protein
MSRGAELAQKAHHVVVVLWRRESATDDPVEQIGVGAVEQGFEAVELRTVEAREISLSKSAEYEIALLRSTMPAPEQDSPAANLEVVLRQAIAAAPRTAHDSFAAQCANISIMFKPRLAMIQIEPPITRNTISTP